MSSARNAGESAICPVCAQPSAEIARVECAKCRRECDLPGVRATLLFDDGARILREFVTLSDYCHVFVIGGSPCTDLTYAGQEHGRLGICGPDSVFSLQCTSRYTYLVQSFLRHISAFLSKMQVQCTMIISLSSEPALASRTSHETK